MNHIDQILVTDPLAAFFFTAYAPLRYIAGGTAPCSILLQTGYRFFMETTIAHFAGPAQKPRRQCLRGFFPFLENRYSTVLSETGRGRRGP